MSEETKETSTPAESGISQVLRDKDGGLAPTEPRMKGKRRKKVSYLTINKIDYVDYKDVNVLRRFINDHGRIVPSRQSGNTAKQQRMIARAIRRAREMALLPFVVTDMHETPRRPRPPRDSATTPAVTAPSPAPTARVAKEEATTTQ